MAAKPKKKQSAHDQAPAGLTAIPGYLADSDDTAGERLIHERLRLGIVSALAVNDMLTFGQLKKLLGASDGNLSVHARKLEEAKLIGCKKSFAGRVPRSEYRLTARGRKVLERYLNHMEALIAATRTP